MVPKGHGLKFWPTNKNVFVSLRGHIQGHQGKDMSARSNDFLRNCSHFFHYPKLQAFSKIQKLPE